MTHNPLARFVRHVRLRIAHKRKLAELQRKELLRAELQRIWNNKQRNEVPSCKPSCRTHHS